MTGIRRAFFWASTSRYAVMAINLVMTVIMARLLTPGEYGVAALGAAVFGIAEAMRALGGGAYLIQHKDLSNATIRTTVTVNLMVTIVVALALVLIAAPLTRYFSAPNLRPYLLVTALGYLTGPIVQPIFALLSREMAFDVIARITVLTAAVNAVASIALAILGFSEMSLAWASAISAVAGALLSFRVWRDRSIFKPLLTEWRGVIAFGAYDGATAVLAQIGESLPSLIFGKILNAEAVGLAQRAVMLCLLPERVILAGVGAVTLPAFSNDAREGRGLKDGYLRATELMTAVLWPALALLALLAHPIVLLLLGRQWLEVVSLVQILSFALLFSFPIGLHYPTLVATGAIRVMPLLIVAEAVVSITILWLAAQHGLRAAAFSTLLIIPFNAFLSVWVVRRFLRFSWRDFGVALRRSIASAVLSTVGPLIIFFMCGGAAAVSIGAAMLAVTFCGIGWLAGLWLTNHPLLHELFRARDVVLQSPFVARFLGGDAPRLRRRHRGAPE